MLSELMIVIAMAGQCSNGSCPSGNYMGDCANGKCASKAEYIDAKTKITFEFKGCDGVTAKSKVSCMFAKDCLVLTPVYNGMIPSPTILRDSSNKVYHVVLDYSKGFVLDECEQEADGSVKYRTKSEMNEYKSGKTASAVVKSSAKSTIENSVADNREVLNAIRELKDKMDAVDKELQNINHMQFELKLRVETLEGCKPAKAATVTSNRITPSTVQEPDVELKRPSEINGN